MKTARKDGYKMPIRLQETTCRATGSPKLDENKKKTWSEGTGAQMASRRPATAGSSYQP
jgi:hypothetical protein